MLFSDTCVWPAFWPSHRADHTCMLGSGIPFVTFQIVFSVSLFFFARWPLALRKARLANVPDWFPRLSLLVWGVGRGVHPRLDLSHFFHCSATANASLVWAGTPARPGGALRNIIARFKVHSLCTQPGIRCTDPGRETFHINPANPQFKDSFSLYGYATWHPMIVTLVFNRPLAGIDHTTASFPCHSVTVLP